MRSSRRRQGKSIRGDIQGLRAVAVLLVFFDHMLGWPTGGFAGVDVFFVISGFLITGLLLREYEKTGHISFPKFYIARAKRIIPAATLVLIVSVLVARVTFTPTRADATLWDAIWAFFFGANWNFASQGTDYFQQDAAVSPLQHYWSLSVEEQFYFVWPWLMLGLFYLFAKGAANARARRIALIAISTITVLSIGWAAYQSVGSPTVAYFSTFTRAWELGLGALLAVIAPIFANLGARTRTIMSWAGLVGIFASVFFITPSSVWPFPGALAPVLATALAIAAGIGETPRHIWVLNNPATRFLGDISYSLYLWHFPVIVFGAAMFPEPSFLGFIVMFLAGIAFAAGAYYAVERPIHKSPLWTPGASQDWRGWRQKMTLPAGLGLLGMLVATFGVQAGLVVYNDSVVAARVEALAAEEANAAATPTPAPSSEATMPPAVRAVHDAVAAGVKASSWPDLSPSLADAPNDKSEYFAADAGCFNATPVEDGCRISEGSRPAVIFGDSTGAALTPALLPYLAENDYAARGYYFSSCAMTTSKTVWPDAPERAATCDDAKTAVLDQLEQSPVELVILMDSSPSYTAIEVPEGLDRRDTWVSTRAEAVERIQATGAKVMIIRAAPEGKPLAECATPNSVPADCRVAPSKAWSSQSSADESVAKGTGATWVNTVDLFCANGACPAIADGTAIRFDATHVSATYAKRIAPAVSALVGQ